MKIVKKLTATDKNRLKNKNNNKKENNTKVPKEMRKVYIELAKTDIYFFAVEVPVKKNIDEENAAAIMTAWNVVNKKLINLESVQIGNGFQNKILKKELVKKEEKKE